MVTMDGAGEFVSSELVASPIAVESWKAGLLWASIEFAHSVPSQKAKARDHGVQLAEHRLR